MSELIRGLLRRSPYICFPGTQRGRIVQSLSTIARVVMDRPESAPPAPCPVTAPDIANIGFPTPFGAVERGTVARPASVGLV